MAPRFFRHGELQLVLVALLATRPMHGYDLMAELTRLFGPSYTPSAGGVYPALDALIAEGLLARQSDGSRTSYAVTETGQTALAVRADLLAHIEDRTGVSFAPSPSIELVIDSFTNRLRRAAHGIEPDQLKTLLDHALDQVLDHRHDHPHPSTPRSTP